MRESGLRWLWLSGLTLLLDQASKGLVVSRIDPQANIPVTAFFSLVHWHNPGAAFSFLATQPGWQRLFFISLGLVAAAIILQMLWRTQGRALFCAAIALILGGAIGNVIDRMSYGYVIDFLLFHWRDWFYPAFNVADSAITLGVGLLLWDGFHNGRDSKQA